MSQPLWKKSLAVSLLLMSAACGAPSLYPAAMAPSSMDAMAAKAKPIPFEYGLGAVFTPEEPRVSGEDGFQTKADLPPGADLRPNMPPIANQVAFGSCTSFAFIKGLREYMARKEGRATELSPRFFWYAARRLYQQKLPNSNARQRNTGVPMFIAAQAAKTFGTLAETVFPYPTLSDFSGLKSLSEEQREAKLNEWAAVAPSNQQFDDAKKWRVQETIYTVGSIHGLRKALSEKKPVVIGVALYDSFMSKEVAKTGQVPLPNLKTDKPVGGHAMCAVGYDNARRHIIVRNSWGTGWGDNGYCYLPYDYFRLTGPDGMGLVLGGYTYR